MLQGLSWYHRTINTPPGWVGEHGLSDFEAPLLANQKHVLFPSHFQS